MILLNCITHRTYRPYFTEQMKALFSFFHTYQNSPSSLFIRSIRSFSALSTSSHSLALPAHTHTHTRVRSVRSNAVHQQASSLVAPGSEVLYEAPGVPEPEQQSLPRRVQHLKSKDGRKDVVSPSESRMEGNRATAMQRPPRGASSVRESDLFGVSDGVSVTLYQTLSCHFTHLLVAAGLWRQRTHAHVLCVRARVHVCVYLSTSTKQLSRQPRDNAAVRDLHRTCGVREDTLVE